MVKQRRVTFIGGPFNGHQIMQECSAPSHYRALERIGPEPKLTDPVKEWSIVQTREVVYTLRQVDAFEWVGLCRG